MADVTGERWSMELVRPMHSNKAPINVNHWALDIRGIAGRVGVAPAQGATGTLQHSGSGAQEHTIRRGSCGHQALDRQFTSMVVDVTIFRKKGKEWTMRLKGPAAQHTSKGTMCIFSTATGNCIAASCMG